MAASDLLGLTAQPIGTQEGTPKDALEAIFAICVDRQIDRIILGLPLNMDGSEGPMAKEVRTFAGQLAERTNLPVELSDERLTSWSVEEDLKGMRGKRRKKKGTVDTMAAALILREYMAEQDGS